MALPKRFRPGDVLDHRDLNAILDEIRAVAIAPGAIGLDVQRTRLGTLLAVPDAQPQWQLCVANGNITARSGATVGTGSVYTVQLDGNTLSTIGDALDVYNPSATTMTSGNGINAGQYCLVTELPPGRLLVVPLECA